MQFLTSAELVAETREQHIVAASELAPGLPSLAIVRAIGNTAADQVTGSYVRIKERYGESIGGVVHVFDRPQSHIAGLLDELNEDERVHGIIVQLPLTDPSETDALCNLVDPHKDVDGLHEDPVFKPATPKAIMNMLEYHEVDMSGRVVVVGRGKLVGAPLVHMLVCRGIEPTIIDKFNADLLPAAAKRADVLISATGVPGLITPEILSDGAVVMDAGVASEDGVLKGDVDPVVYESDLNIQVTPVRGGIGPATVCALFSNVLEAAYSRVDQR